MASHATTVRPSSNALLLIDSEDRFNTYEEARSAVIGGYNASPYDFRITKNQSLLNGSFTRLAVSEVTFPWVIPNISYKTDQIIFNFSRDGTEITSNTVSIQPGFYTPGELADALTTELSDILPGMQVTYGEFNLPLFRFTPPAPYLVSFSPLPYNSEEYPFPPTTKQLFDLLGLLAGDTELSENIVGAASFAQNIRYVDIVCPQLTSNQAVRDTMSQPIARDSLCRIYLGDVGATDGVVVGSPAFSPPGCSPTVIHRQFNPAKYIQWDPAQPVPGFLQFQVYDDSGALLGDFGPGTVQAYYADWSMTLQVSEN